MPILRHSGMPLALMALNTFFFCMLVAFISGSPLWAIRARPKVLEEDKTKLPHGAYPAMAGRIASFDEQK